MDSLRRILIVFTLTIICSIGAAAQSASQESKPATGSITGTVTLKDEPARGVTVMLTQAFEQSQMNVTMLFKQKSVVKTTTDENGVYKFTGVAEGRYTVAPFAPALVAAGSSSGETVNVKDGEELEDVDFDLVPGGVITGRITHADGRPVVGETVKLTRVDSKDKQPTSNPNEFSMLPLPDAKFATDDRGIYRIYGLPAGHYVVSFGQATSSPGQIGMARTRYVNETFHPGVTDKDKATVVELAEGGEAAGVDIKLGLASKTFKASGRVVDATTGRPVAGAVANYGALSSNQDTSGGSGFDAIASIMSLGSIASSKGEFQFTSLVPGRYGAYATFDENSDFYSDVTQFEVKDMDVTGVDVKVRRGLSISGIVSVEGTEDPAILLSLSELQLFGIALDRKGVAPRMLTSKIGGDGSFRFRGVQPGRIRIELNRFFTPTRLGVLRIERNGATQPEGAVAVQNESIIDLRVVLAFAGGIVRGQVNVTNGSISDDLFLSVQARRLGAASSEGQSTTVDATGRFTIEGLLPGTYELTLNGPGYSLDGEPPPAKQTVIVSNEAEAFVTLTLDLKQKKN